MTRFEEFLSPENRSRLENMPADVAGEGGVEDQESSAEDKSRYDRFKYTRTVSEGELNRLVVKILSNDTDMSSEDYETYNENIEEVSERMADIKKESQSKDTKEQIESEETGVEGQLVSDDAPTGKTNARPSYVNIPLNHRPLYKVPQSDIRREEPWKEIAPQSSLKDSKYVTKVDLRHSTSSAQREVYQKPDIDTVERLAKVFNKYGFKYSDLKKLSQEDQDFFNKNKELIILRARMFREVSSLGSVNKRDIEKYNEIMGIAPKEDSSKKVAGNKTQEDVVDAKLEDTVRESDSKEEEGVEGASESLDPRKNTDKKDESKFSPEAVLTEEIIRLAEDVRDASDRKAGKEAYLRLKQAIEKKMPNTSKEERVAIFKALARIVSREESGAIVGEFMTEDELNFYAPDKEETPVAVDESLENQEEGPITIESVYEKVKNKEDMSDEEWKFYAKNNREVNKKLEEDMFAQSERKQGIDLKKSISVDSMADKFIKKDSDLTEDEEKFFVFHNKEVMKRVAEKKKEEELNKTITEAIESQIKASPEEKTLVIAGLLKSLQEKYPDMSEDERLEAISKVKDQIVEQKEIDERKGTLEGIVEGLSLEEARDVYHKARFARGHVIGRKFELPSGDKISTRGARGLEILDILQRQYEIKLSEDREVKINSIVEKHEGEKPENFLEEVIEGTLLEEEAELNELLTSRERDRATKFKTWWRKHSKARLVGGLGTTVAMTALSIVSAPFMGARAVMGGVGAYIGVESLLERTKSIGHKGLVDELAKEWKDNMPDEMRVLAQELNPEVLEREYARLKMLQLEKGVSIDTLAVNPFREHKRNVKGSVMEALIKVYHKNTSEKIASEVKGATPEDTLSAILAKQIKGTEDMSREFHEKESVNKIKRKTAAAGLATLGVLNITGLDFMGEDSVNVPTESEVEAPLAPEVTPVEPSAIELPSDDLDAIASMESLTILHTVEKGDNLWKILESSLDSAGKLEGMSEGQRTYVIDALKDRFAAMSPDEVKAIGISSGDINLLTAGDAVDTSLVMGDIALVGETIKDASDLAPETIAIIEGNNRVVTEWLVENKDTLTEPLNGEMVDEIINESRYARSLAETPLVAEDISQSATSNVAEDVNVEAAETLSATEAVPTEAEAAVESVENAEAVEQAETPADASDVLTESAPEIIVENRFSGDFIYDARDRVVGFEIENTYTNTLLLEKVKDSAVSEYLTDDYVSILEDGIEDFRMADVVPGKIEKAREAALYLSQLKESSELVEEGSKEWYYLKFLMERLTTPIRSMTFSHPHDTIFSNAFIDTRMFK